MNIFMIAGEASGDLHGARLIESLQSAMPENLYVLGVIGPQMRALGAHCIVPMENLQVMGFIDVLKELPKIISIFSHVKKVILRTNPDVVVTIDYPGFNLRMMRSLRKQGYKGKLIHYICPSVWAWKKNRIQDMARDLDALLVILPFEVDCFKNTLLPVTYVGNPIIDSMRNRTYHSSWRENFKIPETAEIISIFPGSRKKEIELNFPYQLRSAYRLQQKYPNSHIVISCNQAKYKDLLLKHIDLLGVRKSTIIPAEYNYECMRESRVALAKSGTVTLELALHLVPTVTLYKMSMVNWLLAKYLFRINLPYYTLANISAKQEIFPEFISYRLDESLIDDFLLNFYESTPNREECIQKCKELRDSLFLPNSPSQVAAEAILACATSS